MIDGTDVLRILAADHRDVEDLFQRYEAANDPAEKTKIAHSIVHELAVHAEVEELYFYPRLRDEFHDGAELTDGAVNEHMRMKQALNDIDSMTAVDDEFDGLMRTLVREVRHHVRGEESDLFPRAREVLSAEQRRDLGARLERARSMVPTRPHSDAPTPPGAETGAEPPTALSDRVRNAVRAASG